MAWVSPHTIKSSTSNIPITPIPALWRDRCFHFACKRRIHLILHTRTPVITPDDHRITLFLTIKNFQTAKDYSFDSSRVFNATGLLSYDPSLPFETALSHRLSIPRITNKIHYQIIVTAKSSVTVRCFTKPNTAPTFLPPSLDQVSFRAEMTRTDSGVVGLGLYKSLFPIPEVCSTGHL